MKTMTKAAVSNLVFGGGQPYGRHIEFTTEHDSDGTDESLTGILNPKLSWVKKWDKLPDSLKKFEEERASKAMQVNCNISAAEIKAIQLDLDEQRCRILDETEELGEALEKLEEFDQLHKGWFRDLDDGDMTSEPGMHMNWVTFTQGDEEVAMDDEGVFTMAKTRADEFLQEPNEHSGNAKRVKIEEKNWEHLRSMEGKRKLLEDWFTSKQNAIFNEYLIGAVKMERTIERLKKIEQLLLDKRDESFQQSALDSIEPTPKGTPQFRKRDHYLTAGGWTKKWEKANPGKKFHEEHGKTVFLIGKWRVLFQVFTESRKLTGPQFLWLTERNLRMNEAVLSGAKKIVEPKRPSKEPKDLITLNVEKIEREWALIEAKRLYGKLNHFREFFLDAEEAFDVEMREWAFNKGIAASAALKTHMEANNITTEDLESRCF